MSNTRMVLLLAEIDRFLDQMMEEVVPIEFQDVPKAHNIDSEAWIWFRWNVHLNVEELRQKIAGVLYEDE